MRRSVDARQMGWCGISAILLLRIGTRRPEVVARKANGAGIAADPTLTGVWMTLAFAASGGPSASSAAGHTWRPMSSLLLPGLATGLARDLSPALAPASGFCSRAGVRPSKPEAFDHRCHARSLGRGLVPLSIQRAAAWGLSPFPLHSVSTRFPACPMPPLHAHHQRACLHWAEASCMPSLDERVDECHRHPWDKNPGNFKALRLSVPVVSCPEDKLKVRLNWRSDNILTAKFSTKGNLPCGHEWISQRLVAFVTRGCRRPAQNRPQGVTLPGPRRCGRPPDSAFFAFAR